MKRTILLTILALLFIPIALATTKPITAQTNYNNQEASIFVEIDFIDSKALCVVNPTIQTSNSGIFVSNLGNLVLEQDKKTKCSGLWKAGDSVWYAINGQESQRASIELGTGLQELPAMRAAQQANQKEQTSSSSSSSGGAGGGSVGSTNNKESEQEPSSGKQINLELTYENNIANLQASSPGTLRIVLFEEVNNIIIESWQQEQAIELQEQINTTRLQPGRYYLQAFALEEGRIVASSQKIEFYTKANAKAIPKKQELSFVGKVIQIPGQAAREQPILIGMITFSICFILIGVVIVIIARRQKRQVWSK